MLLLAVVEASEDWVGEIDAYLVDLLIECVWHLQGRPTSMYRGL